MSTPRTLVRLHYRTALSVPLLLITLCADTQAFYDLADVHGDVVIGPDHLLIKGVPVVAPAGGSAGAERGGEELILSLDLRVEKGQHTLITGPK
jgi:hypothetical protein